MKFVRQKGQRISQLWLFKFLLPILKVFKRNMYDKFAFFTAVMQEDTIAPQVGELEF
ncbi:MAG: NAD-dependent epimerase/dehydratase [Ferruginibacter sp.]|nr:NAD-dependent epimerase/dehydratase [Ferruginibacter sp.]